MISRLAAWTALTVFAATTAHVAEQAPSGNADPRSPVDQIVFDFGHVGIDYNVYYRYPFVNHSADTVHIKDIVVHCDCSSAFAVDTLLAPGDSTTINLRYNTRNFYGPQNKQVTVISDYPSEETLNLFYLSIVGQWFEGVKPDPLAAFFLPPHKVHTITIPNERYDRLSIAQIDQANDYYDVLPVKGEAGKGESLAIEIRPSENLQAGTRQSNVSLTVDPGELGELIRLTIPIKIVRY